MPHVKVGDIQIYYEILGAGSQPLTLIRGLGADLTAWFPQIPEFSKHFKTVVFDNRGAGRTDKPDAPYSMRQMADDTNGLLEALDIRRTALLGMSMGGAIAQEFAINYPEKLSSLVLVCTSFGGPESEFFTLPGEIQEHHLFCDETIEHRREVIAGYSEARSKFPISADSLGRQPVP